MDYKKETIEGIFTWNDQGISHYIIGMSAGSS